MKRAQLANLAPPLAQLRASCVHPTPSLKQVRLHVRLAHPVLESREYVFPNLFRRHVYLLWTNREAPLVPRNVLLAKSQMQTAIVTTVVQEPSARLAIRRAHLVVKTLSLVPAPQRVTRAQVDLVPLL